MLYLALSYLSLLLFSVSFCTILSEAFVRGREVMQIVKK